MEPKQVLDFICRRRSVRRFLKKAIPDDLLEVLMKCAMAAPSGNNVQPWEFVIVRDPALKEKIRTDMAKVMKMIDDFETIHQNRLITGICMPRASYLYIDMTDSLKRMAKELAAFADIV